MKCLLRVISGRAGVPAEVAAHSQNLTYIITARVRLLAYAINGEL